MGTEEKDDLVELSREISRVIEENRKFLDRVLDDDFEPEKEDGAELDKEDEAGEMVEL